MALLGYREVLGEHRELLARVSEQWGVARLRRVYDLARADLERKLVAAARGRLGDTFTAHQMRTALLQVRHGQALLSQRMAGVVTAASMEAHGEGLRKLERDIARLEQRYTGAATVIPVAEAARFAGVMDARKTSLMRDHATSMARYGVKTVRAVEDELMVSLASGETNAAAIDRVGKAIDGEWWQAERIVRSETSWAFSASARDGIAEAAAELPDMMMRWSEHVGDDGEPLDDRVSVDSLAMHGQVAPPTGLFTMPDSAPTADAKGNTDVPDSLAGRTFAHPPNRPNDRAVISPWRRSWGIPGWEWRGRRVWLVRP